MRERGEGLWQPGVISGAFLCVFKKEIVTQANVSGNNGAITLMQPLKV